MLWEDIDNVLVGVFYDFATEGHFHSIMSGASLVGVHCVRSGSNAVGAAMKTNSEIKSNKRIIIWFKGYLVIFLLQLA